MLCGIKYFYSKEDEFFLFSFPFTVASSIWAEWENLKSFTSQDDKQELPRSPAAARAPSWRQDPAASVTWVF